MVETVFSDKKKEYTCLFCGKKFIRWICQVRDERKVKCSRLCNNRWNMKHRDQTGEKNRMWKGGITKKYYKKHPRILSNSYSAIHRWLHRRIKKPKFCECCMTNPPRDLANISQKYKRDLSDWEWLCRRCHMTKDNRLLKVKEIGLYPKNGENNPNYKNGKYVNYKNNKKKFTYQFNESLYKRDSKGKFV